MTKETATIKWRIRKNANGTFSHYGDPRCEWEDETGCRTDLMFYEDEMNARLKRKQWN